MAIESSAFGRITLTGPDAEKFRNQTTYGKPKKAALDSAARGVKLSRQMQENGGTLTVQLKRV